VKKFKNAKVLEGGEAVKSALSLAFTALMLTVIQPPVNWWPLAWVSFVPFILACSPQTKPKRLAIIAYTVSLLYWLGNLYWVFPITVLGWAAFCVYTALLWPILALTIRYCRVKKIPLFLAVPVLVVGTERLQGVFLGGFFWRFLAHSQFQNITIIQIADIFGAAGVSFLIAMVNGLLAELILDAQRFKNIFKISNLIKTGLVGIAVVATFVYGRWRIEQSDKFIETGPLVASLQSNVPQSVKRTFQADREIFDDLMLSSKAAAEAGAELIIWPETMVQATLNPDVWPFLSPTENYEVFDKALREHSRETAYVLVGSYGANIQPESYWDISLVEHNSAFLYTPAGQQYNKRYDKIHLVLFGEYLPFRNTFRPLYNFLMKCTPYNYDYSLGAGSEYTIFEITTRQSVQPNTYKFGVIICYEDTIPAMTRRFAMDEQGRKRIHWLVNISNDGWFVRFKDGKVLPSTELTQHAAVCAFRSVENRLAIVRSVNTGISCLIDSLGRIHDGYISASADFPTEAMNRQGIAGWFVDKMPIDKRVTFFSRHGQWLDFCCVACLIVSIIVLVLAQSGRVRRLTIHSSR